MNKYKFIYKKLSLFLVLGSSILYLSACSSNANLDTTNNQVKTTNNTSSLHNKKVITAVVKKNPIKELTVNTDVSKELDTYKNLKYGSKDFNSKDKMILLNSDNNKVSLSSIKEEYLYKDVSTLISIKGKPDYFLREQNSGVLRYTINNCPIIFFIVHKKKTDRIDNIKSVCKNIT